MNVGTTSSRVAVFASDDVTLSVALSSIAAAFT